MSASAHCQRVWDGLGLRGPLTGNPAGSILGSQRVGLLVWTALYLLVILLPRFEAKPAAAAVLTQCGSSLFTAILVFLNGGIFSSVSPVTDIHPPCVGTGRSRGTVLARHAERLASAPILTAGGSKKEAI